MIPPPWSKQASEPPESECSPPPVGISNFRGVTNALSASWVGTGHLVEEGVARCRGERADERRLRSDGGRV
ncbi:hypothetical protein EVAR_45645_1 [Eumeta japonica]|uniref:Uncharacterized protein n=1 Tax=Eumeta variegata TaxID=151549 RepID=A0A4C1Y3B9_EUMVA|nr:hypothetical protein EVAR_45645_1 [Eumeta japonica]